MPRPFRSFALRRVVAATLGLAAVLHVGTREGQAAADLTRYATHAELTAALQALAKAHPTRATLVEIGRTRGGRALHALQIAAPGGAPVDTRPGVLVVGNLEADGLLGSMLALAAADALLTSTDPAITAQLASTVFYIVPRVNADGAEAYFDAPKTGRRTNLTPFDEDNDGRVDEDGPEDLNKDGLITMMRVKSPTGPYAPHKDDARLMKRADAQQGEAGGWQVYWEGIDNDGDGFLNEDGPGGYDPNRNWASDWQPNYIQGGSMDYPFQLPEARAVADFMMARPNIAGVQSYHNAGGMILRGPGAEMQGEYPQADVRVYDELGRTGERMLPYYRYLVIWSGLYTVHGGFIDWTNDGLGVLSFSNELWNGGQYFNSPDLKDQQRNPESPIAPRVSSYFFDDRLELGEQFVEWKAFEHPSFGPVEMGGWKHTFGRVPPRFMNEELCHRNMAFTLYQADQMPKIAFGAPTVESMGQGVWRVRVPIVNPKLTPTILAQASRNFVVRPDLLTVDGKGVEVVAAGWVRDRFRQGATDLIDQKDLTRLLIRNGHPGHTTRVIEYLVKGGPEMTLTYDSAKGGTAKTTIALKAPG